jgi:hypothetical protein
MSCLVARPPINACYANLRSTARFRQIREPTDPSSERRDAEADRDLKAALAHLQDLIPRLRLTMAVVSVCAVALRHQNADSDGDVADVLQRHAADRLSVELDQLERVVRRLSRSQRVDDQR